MEVNAEKHVRSKTPILSSVGVFAWKIGKIKMA